MSTTHTSEGEPGHVLVRSGKVKVGKGMWATAYASGYIFPLMGAVGGHQNTTSRRPVTCERVSAPRTFQGLVNEVWGAGGAGSKSGKIAPTTHNLLPAHTYLTPSKPSQQQKAATPRRQTSTIPAFPNAAGARTYSARGGARGGRGREYLSSLFTFLPFDLKAYVGALVFVKIVCGSARTPPNNNNEDEPSYKTKNKNPHQQHLHFTRHSPSAGRSIRPC